MQGQMQRVEELRGGGGGVLMPSQRARLTPEEGQPELSMVLLDLCCEFDMLSSLLEQSQLKMELVHLYEACYTSKFLTLI
jgi:hypothetical protein